MYIFNINIIHTKKKIIVSTIPPLWQVVGNYLTCGISIFFEVSTGTAPVAWSFAF
jgi:hypothetical protein